MKALFLFLFSTGLLYTTSTEAQLLKTLGDKAKQKVNQRANSKVDKAMDKTLDDAEAGTKTKKAEETTENVTSENASAASGAAATKESTPALSYTSKYDFVPGEKLVAYEDFSKEAVGDFPTRWNTNATAEVVTINNKEGKWLKLNKEGVFHPEFITTFPDNYTFEFDIAVNNEWRGTHMAVNIAHLKKPEDFKDYYHYVRWQGDHTVHMQLKPGQTGRTPGYSKILVGKDGNYSINNDVEFKTWDNGSKNFAHVAMWRQGTRLRVYLNGEKIWDLPRAFDATSKHNAVTFGMQGSYGPDDYMLLGNLRLAVGAPDTRNKLITEGRFVTRGILFDVNSDKIKPESAGALKDIANVLSENITVKVKIVGHTDGDGDDKANIALSAKRAEAVKNYLIKEFGIAAANLQTEGKGESQPVDKNETPDGKANNRRVEFVKL